MKTMMVIIKVEGDPTPSLTQVVDVIRDWEGVQEVQAGWATLSGEDL